MARVIQELIKRPLADEVLFGALSHGGGTVRVTVVKGKLKLNFDKETEAVS
jgi:ATP-dependent Clp protease ATP-binding subunit ClpA